MIQVHYPHPPRKLGFYLGYLLWMAIIVSPIVLLFMTWMDTIPININLMFVEGFLLICLLFYSRTAMEQYILNYDLLIEKSRDVSHEMRYPPDNVAEGIRIVEALGFSRLGEDASFAGFNKEEATAWHLISASNDVLFEIGDVGIPPYFAVFKTWFKGQRYIQTFYPTSDTIKQDDFRVAGIGDSLEAAYNYHLRQVADFERKYGAPIRFNSMEGMFKAEKVYRKKFFSRLMNKGANRLFIKWLSSTTIIAAGMYWFLGYLVAVSNAEFSLAYANFDRSLTMVYGGIALAVQGLSEMLLRNSAKGKKK